MRISPQETYNLLTSKLFSLIPKVQTLTVFVYLLTGASSAFAADAFSPKAGQSRGAPSHSKMTFSLGAHYGNGTIANQSGSIASRSVSTLSASASVGYKNGMFNPFGYVEYGSTSQVTETSEVGNTNLAGNGQHVGLGLTLDLGDFDFTGAYIFYGKYALSKTNSRDQTLVFSNPTGYITSLNYKIRAELGIQFFYRQLEYSRVTVGENTTEIKDNKLLFPAYGVGVLCAF